MSLTIYNAVRNPPKEALKPIKGGRLSGYTDINPMWRIKALTEQFGVCGIGWKYTITKQWTEQGANGEVAAFTNIDLYIKVNGEWSDAIPGTGGSSFIAKERSGLYTSDECFKMSLTDAISVACKSLGFAADIYWNNDRSKNDKTEKKQMEEPQKKIDDTKAQVIYDLLQKTNADVKAFLKYYGVKTVEDMTVEVWTKATKALKGKLTKGEG